MAPRAAYSSFAQFRDERILTSPPGTFALHAQLHPDDYPSDIDYFEACRQRGEPLRPGPEYLDFISECSGRGIELGRLAVVKYFGNRRTVREAHEVFDPMVERGEQVRLAQFANHFARLITDFEDNPEALRYMESAPSDNPKASFWALTAPGSTDRTVWMMDYEDGVLAETPVQTTPPDSTVGRYVEFWHDVFASDIHSKPLAAL